MIDGRPIAATITLVHSAGHAWYWKTAYDEAYARDALGVFLTAALTEELADDETISQTDPCAAAGNPMMDRIWRERLTLCYRLIPIKHPRAAFALRPPAGAVARKGLDRVRPKSIRHLRLRSHR